MFENSKEFYTKTGILLIVAEGHIVAGSMGIVARCKDDAEAIDVLTKAGYRRMVSSPENIIFSPVN